MQPPDKAIKNQADCLLKNHFKKIEGAAQRF